MPKITLKSKPVMLLSELKKRQQLFNKKSISASIKIPVGGKDSRTNALEWVLFHEFGTATHFDKRASEYGIAPPKGGGSKYLIHRRERPFIKRLKFPAEGGEGYVYPSFVLHPGFRPLRYIRTVLGNLKKFFEIEVGRQVRAKYDTLTVEGFFKEEMMKVKDLIAKGIDANLETVEREDDAGKLHGMAPGDVFRNQAIVVGVSGPSESKPGRTVSLGGASKSSPGAPTTKSGRQDYRYKAPNIHRIGGLRSHGKTMIAYKKEVLMLRKKGLSNTQISNRLRKKYP